MPDVITDTITVPRWIALNPDRIEKEADATRYLTEHGFTLPVTVQQVASVAADTLEAEGWTCFDRGRPGIPSCATGALAQAAFALTDPELPCEFESFYSEAPDRYDSPRAIEAHHRHVLYFGAIIRVLRLAYLNGMVTGQALSLLEQGAVSASLQMVNDDPEKMDAGTMLALLRLVASQ